MHSAFKVDKAAGVFASKGLIKRRPPSKDQDGVVLHKLALTIDCFSSDIMSKMHPLFPGADASAKAIAAAESQGTVMVAKQKLGVCLVAIRDFREGNLLFEDPIARGGIPRLVIGDSAKTSHLKVDVEIAIPRAQAGLVVDYFKADILISLAVSQLVIGDQAKADEASTAQGGSDDDANVPDDVDIDDGDTPERSRISADMEAAHVEGENVTSIDSKRTTRRKGKPE